MALTGTSTAVNGINGDHKGNGINGTAGDAFLSGLILPPPDVRSIVDKTALHVGKNADPRSLETKIRNRNDARFAFLTPNDPYHAYYLHRLELVRSGDVSALGVDEPGASKGPQGDLDDGRPKIPEPPAYEFLDPVPPMNAADLCVRLALCSLPECFRPMISVPHATETSYV